VGGLEHNALVAGLAAALELFMIWSTWWAIKRYRSLRSHLLLDKVAVSFR